MTPETRFLVELKWKEQAIADCLTWAGAMVKDEKRLKDFEAGVCAGWNECIKTLMLHGLLNLKD